MGRPLVIPMQPGSGDSSAEPSTVVLNPESRLSPGAAGHTPRGNRADQVETW